MQVTLEKLNESRKIEKALKDAFKKRGQDVLTRMYDTIIDLLHETSGEMWGCVDFDETSESYQQGIMDGMRMAIIQKLVSYLEQELRVQQKVSPLHWFQITSTRKDIL